jgi:hypothetical protein
MATIERTHALAEDLSVGEVVSPDDHPALRKSCKTHLSISGQACPSASARAVAAKPYNSA